MLTYLIELDDYFMLCNRIGIWLICFDDDEWQIQAFRKDSSFYLRRKDFRPVAYL